MSACQRIGKRVAMKNCALQSTQTSNNCNGQDTWSANKKERYQRKFLMEGCKKGAAKEGQQMMDRLEGIQAMMSVWDAIGGRERIKETQEEKN